MFFALFITTCLIAALIYIIVPKSTPSSICVMVMGDLGRSPRMQYHTLSLAEHYPNHTIELVGIRGAPPHPLILANPRINIHYFQQFPGLSAELSARTPKTILRYVQLIAKVLYQVVDIATVLLTIEHPQVILLQTPPAIPLLAVTRLLSIILRSKVIVDWHNFGYTLLNIGPKKPELLTNLPGIEQQRSPLSTSLSTPQPQFQPQQPQQPQPSQPKLNTMTELAYHLERWSGYFATHSFCVTHSMKTWLSEYWNITAHALHDQPPHIFIPSQHLPPVKMNELFTKFGQQQTLVGVYQEPTSTNPTHRTPSQWLRTNLTSPSPKPQVPQPLTNFQNLRQNPNRPFLCLSSTSWTEDEDFSVLLNGLLLTELLLVHYNMENHHKPPQTLLCIITGKGDLKRYYELLLDYFHNTTNNPLSRFEQENGVKLFPSIMWSVSGSNSIPSHNDPAVWSYLYAGELQSNTILLQKLSTLLNKNNTNPSTYIDPITFTSILSKIQSQIISLFYRLHHQQHEQEEINLDNEVAIFPLQNVRITTAWLDIDDYPTLLSCSDLGISLHQSSSGLDLPMKIVDMFGTCLPVLAVGYNCINELVQHGRNGLLFPQDNFVQLATTLYQLIPGLIGSRYLDQTHVIDAMSEARTNETPLVFDTPNPTTDLHTQLYQLCLAKFASVPHSQRIYPISPQCTLDTMRDYLFRQRPQRSWKRNWDIIAKPIFDKVITNPNPLATLNNSIVGEPTVDVQEDEVPVDRSSEDNIEVANQSVNTHED